MSVVTGRRSVRKARLPRSFRRLDSLTRLSGSAAVRRPRKKDEGEACRKNRTVETTPVPPSASSRVSRGEKNRDGGDDDGGSGYRRLRPAIPRREIVRSVHRAPPSEALPVSPPPRIHGLVRRVPGVNSKHDQDDCQTQPALDSIVPHGEGTFLPCTAPRLLVPVVGYCSTRSRCVPGRNTVLWLTVSSGSFQWGLPLRSSPVHRSRCSPLHGSHCRTRHRRSTHAIAPWHWPRTRAL